MIHINSFHTQINPRLLLVYRNPWKQSNIAVFIYSQRVGMTKLRNRKAIPIIDIRIEINMQQIRHATNVDFQTITRSL